MAYRRTFYQYGEKRTRYQRLEQKLNGEPVQDFYMQKSNKRVLYFFSLGA
jgi:hypothetical protein